MLLGLLSIKEPDLYATCETTDCPSAWQPAQVVGDVTVMCGVCGNQITNITNIKPDEGTVLPEWISEMLQTQNSDA